MKILTAYFSLKGETIAPGRKIVIVEKGNTAFVAEFVHNAVGGELFEIQTEKTYLEDHFKLVHEAQEEILNEVRPALKQFAADDFDVLFLGYPNWWNTIPMPVVTFLEHYNWSKKIIVPFCTSGGGGLGESVSDIEMYAKGAKVLPGYHVNGSKASMSEKETVSWAKSVIRSIVSEEANKE